MLIKDVATEWLQYRKPNLKRPTHARYRWLIERCIVPEVGNVPVDGFDRVALQKYTNSLPEAPARRKKKLGRKARKAPAEGTSKGYGIDTVKNAVQCLKMILRFAAEVGYCAALPSYKVDWPKTYDYATVSKVKALSDAQARRLFAELKDIIINPASTEVAGAEAIGEDNNRRYALGAMLALKSGMRIGEVCAFSLEKDYDCFEKAVTVNRTVVSYQDEAGHWVREITSPKTKKSERAIPLDDGAASLLESYAPARDLLIPGGDSRRSTPDPKTLRNWFNRHIRSHGYPAITFHKLRHTYATRLLASGADYKIVSELLGHADVSITMRIYAMPDKDQKRAAIGKVEWD